MPTLTVDANIKDLCGKLAKNSVIDPALYEKYHIKRGLRNSDGTGVKAGITNICNVHGYLLNEGELEPIPGQLIYRGYSITDIVENVEEEDRYGYEETSFLLLFGHLPTPTELKWFNDTISENRDLPRDFVEDMILKAPSKNIMNKLSRSILALYSYDPDCEKKGLENEMRIAMSLIAKLPVIMAAAYQVKRRVFDNQSMIMHPVNYDENTAQCILSLLRPDRQYTKEEAQMLDRLLMLQAEHGGGNNSTFTTRVLTSSGTDPYSTYSSAICSLKGPRHGGANHRVMMMMNDLMEHVDDWESDAKVKDYLAQIVRKEVGDHSGLIYGMGHAVYTISDPRAVILKQKARKLAGDRGLGRQFDLFERVERLAPEVFAGVKGDTKVISANVDFYSGLVYECLGIPSDLYTPLFAVSRIAGWCAHRIEEIETCGRIMRPAYRSLAQGKKYVPLDERG